MASSTELKALIDAWVEQYIRQTVNFTAGSGILTATRLNELFNLLISQGDNAATAIAHIRDFLTAYMTDMDTRVTNDISTTFTTWANAKTIEINTTITNAQSATTAANTATEAAVTAKQDADTATGAAITAATTAVGAATAATTAATDIQAAVENLEVTYAPRLTGVESELAQNTSQISTHSSQIASLSSGSPKGVYATVSALTAAYPSGNSNTYVVLSDNKWYYWNGSAWTAGSLWNPPLISGAEALINQGGTVTYDGSNLIGSVSATFYWCAFDSDKNVIQFKITSATDWFVVSNETNLAGIIGLTGSDYGLFMSISTTNLISAIVTIDSNTAHKYLIGDTVKVERNGYIFTFSVMRSGTANFVKLFTFDISSQIGNATINKDKYAFGFMGNGTNQTLAQNVVLSSSFPVGRFTKWIGKTWNSLGDSITYYDLYQPKLMSILGLAAYTNYGVSGTCITATGSSDTQAISVRYADMNNTADLITVFGGTNDYGTAKLLGVYGDTVNTTFYGALYTLCAGLVTKYPGKRILFFTPLQRDFQGEPVQPGVGANSAGFTLKQYVDAIIEVCGDFGIPVLDLYRKSGITYQNIDTYLSDRLHPKEPIGYQRLANLMAPFIEDMKG